MINPRCSETELRAFLQKIRVGKLGDAPKAFYWWNGEEWDIFIEPMQKLGGIYYNGMTSYTDESVVKRVVDLYNSNWHDF